MSFRHLGQYKGNFYIIDEVLIANLSPLRPRLHGCFFQIVPFSYPWVCQEILTNSNFFPNPIPPTQKSTIANLLERTVNLSHDESRAQ